MKRIAVLRGGPSDEYDVSMRTGQAVLAALSHSNYLKRDIVITRKGEWLDSGMVRTPEAALEGVDAVFIALHGHYGEDGQIQKMLHRKHIPYTGSGALASATAFNKAFTKKILSKHGLLMPKHYLLRGESLWSVASELDELLEALGPELFVKPNTSGSSHATSRVYGKEQLETFLETMLPKHGTVLVEQFIAGREATVSVLQDFRNEAHYAMPVIEIIPPTTDTHYSTKSKYSGETQLICPGSFTYEEKEKLTNAAIMAHVALGCDHYSRTDFIVVNGDIYFLELNTLPGLTETSLFPKAAQTIGLEFNDLVFHLIESARV